MISKPEAYCPLCGGKYTILEAVRDTRRKDTVICYAECDCRAADLTVKHGKVTRIKPRDPVDAFENYDELTVKEYDEYLTFVEMEG